MFYKIIKKTHLFLFLCFTSCILSNDDLDSIKTIHSFDEVQFSDIKKDTLVIFDADDTLIQPTDTYLINEYSPEGIALRQALLQQHPELKNLYDLRSIILLESERYLVEEHIIEKINNLKERNIPVIVCTALYSGKYGLIDSLEKWRFEHLKALGFEGSFNDKIFKLNSPKRNPIFYKGVLLSDAEEKGIVIGDFLDKMMLNPQEIVMFDDLAKPLNHVKDECKKRNIKFKGYLYKGAIEKCWNDQLINFQINHLFKNNKWLSDSEAEKLLNQLNNSKKLILLQGASRCGKSTICKSIEKHENWKSITSVYFDYAQNVFNALFPKEFECIKSGIESHNIRPAISSNYYFYKPNLDVKQKENVKKAVDTIQNHFKDSVNYKNHKEEFNTYSINLIQNNLKNGFNIITDIGWHVGKEKIQAMSDDFVQVFSVLLYCPFSDIINRLFEINKECLKNNNFSNYRLFIEPLKSFTHFYDFSYESKDSIDELDKNEFIKVLTEIEQYLPRNVSDENSRFIMNEINSKELIEFKNNFLKQFPENQTIYIIPKVKYNLLIRTDKCTPEECINKIIEHTKL